MFVHTSKLQPLLAASLVTTSCTMFGMVSPNRSPCTGKIKTPLTETIQFVWAVGSNHGASELPPEKTISSSERSFRILQALSAVAGSWTGACIRQSDWTRFAKTKRAPAIHQLVSGPVTVTICPVLGAFATSAIKIMYGKAIWNPISVLEFLFDRDYSAGTRAGCFFAGLGFFHLPGGH
jgi:nucleobase:cation symporter-1, NCS1 family